MLLTVVLASSCAMRSTSSLAFVGANVKNGASECDAVIDAQGMLAIPAFHRSLHLASLPSQTPTLCWGSRAAHSPSPSRHKPKRRSSFNWLAVADAQAMIASALVDDLAQVVVYRRRQCIEERSIRLICRR